MLKVKYKNGYYVLYMNRVQAKYQATFAYTSTENLKTHFFNVCITKNRFFANMKKAAHFKTTQQGYDEVF